MDRRRLPRHDHGDPVRGGLTGLDRGGGRALVPATFLGTRLSTREGCQPDRSAGPAIGQLQPAILRHVGPAREAREVPAVERWRAVDRSAIIEPGLEVCGAVLAVELAHVELL